MIKEVIGITGASGFIGQNLIQRLKVEDISVRIIDKEKDLRDQVMGCKAIVHLAAINNFSSPGIESANVEYTRKLGEAIQAHVPDCLLIFTSSFAVYKIPQKGEVISEEYITDPRNRYGQTKLEAENIIKRSECNAWILRLSNVYGPGMPPFKHSVVSTFMELIKQGKEITIDGDGSQTRDFVYVDDAVSAIILALKKKLAGVRIVNICSGNDINLNDLVKKISQNVGREAKVKYNVTADSATAGFWKGDRSLAKKLLGWEPKIYI